MESELSSWLGASWETAALMFDRLFIPFWETVYMVLVSTILSLVFGLALAVVMVVTGAKGLHPCRSLYTGLDFVVNLLRSFPFIILIIAIIPFTRFVVGTSIGSTATIVPLTIAATPFVARIMEASLMEVDRGVIEAARSFGAGNLQIIFKVMFKEALPAITLNIAVVAINLLGYSAMAGAVGGGGLGDTAIKYGYYRFEADTMAAAVILLIIMVQVMQMLGNFFYQRLK